MSNRLVKNGMSMVRSNDSGIVLPDDNESLLELVVTKSGVQLKAPRIAPQDVCKILQGIAVDVMFANFQKEDTSKIQSV